ncbi:MAG: hypothetical protein QOJ76_1985 [Acidobacteriota bacterium]|nr:hypothetical protein [Acidobacteriota bacterium]
MRRSVPGTTLSGHHAAVWYALLGVACLLLLLILTFGLKGRAPVVETVTTGAQPPTPAPTPVYFTPTLPARDADVEQAGDRIAEAEVYLKKRQSAAALAALTRARRATTRALESRQRKGSQGDALASALKELDAVQHAIERGAYEDAHRQLVALDRNLDHLDY